MTDLEAMRLALVALEAWDKAIKGITAHERFHLSKETIDAIGNVAVPHEQARNALNERLLAE